VIVAVDPGSRATGVALFTGPAPALTAIKRATAEDARALLAWTKDHGASLVLVEDQHVPRDPRRFNWPSLQKLILAAHRWVVIAELLGLEVVRVKPAQWQGPMLRGVPRTEDGKKLTTKQRCKRAVRSTWDTVMRFDGLPDEARRVAASKVTEDQADAAMIGRWWQLHGNAARSGQVSRA
jgi:hypothetical protein